METMDMDTEDLLAYSESNADSWMMLPCLICSSNARQEKGQAFEANDESLPETTTVPNATSLEMFELLCHYFQLSATDRPGGIENMNIFCDICLKTVSEILLLHKRKVGIEKDIATKIKAIETVIRSVDEGETIGDSFGIEFRERVRRPKSKIEKPSVVQREAKSKVPRKKLVKTGTRAKKVVSKNSKAQNNGEEMQFGHIVEIEPSLVNQMVLDYEDVENVEIKIQPEDFSEFEDEDSFLIEPDFLVQNDNQEYQKPTEYRETSSQRALRPRRSTRNATKNSYRDPDSDEDFDQPPASSQVTGREKVKAKSSKNVKIKDVKEEPSEDPNQFLQESDCMSSSENEKESDAFDPLYDSDDPEVHFSENSEPSEDSNSNSDGEKEDWNASTPRVRKRKYTRSRLKGEGEDVIVSPDGKILYKDIEIIEVKTSNGFQFTCSKCGRQINVSLRQIRVNRESKYYRIKLHIRASHFGAYCCPICKKTLSCGKTLNRHIRAHNHTSDQPIARCDICQKPFKTAKRDFLHMHTWSHKSEEEKAQAIASGEKAPRTYAEKLEASKIKNPTSFPCSKCDRVFYWKSLLLKHENRVHVPDEEKVKNFLCSVCNKTFASRGDLTAHKRSVCEKDKLARMFFCAYCDRKYITQDECKRHERKHTKEKPFHCPNCSKCYSSERTLKSHVKECDGKKKGNSGGVLFEGMEFFHDDDETGFTLRCGACDYIVEHDSSKQPRSESYRKMHVHIRGKHLGKYKCHICDKLLSEPKGLRNHLATHDKEARYFCEICAKPFRTRVQSNKYFYKAHLWTHFSEDEKQERIAAGETPPLSYAQRLELVKKSKQNTDNFLQCHQCGKRFAWQCQLTKHERVHAGTRTHQCSTCGKFYATADGLNSHTKHVHDKDKIHKWHYCTFDNCGKKFSHKFAWRKHERSHRRDKLKPYQCSGCMKSFSLEKNFTTHVRVCDKRQEEGQAHSQTPVSVDKHQGQSMSPPIQIPNPISAMSTMSLPRSHSSNNPSHMHQLNQFRQQVQLPSDTTNPPTSNPNSDNSLHPGIPGHHFMTGSAGTQNPRFYEDGSVYQNFF